MWAIPGIDHMAHGVNIFTVRKHYFDFLPSKYKFTIFLGKKLFISGKQ